MAVVKDGGDVGRRCGNYERLDSIKAGLHDASFVIGMVRVGVLVGQMDIHAGDVRAKRVQRLTH